MTRLHRDLKRALWAAYPGAHIRIEIAKKHDFVVVQLPDGKIARVTFAGSPSNLDNTLRAVVRDVAARFATPERRPR